MMGNLASHVPKFSAISEPNIASPMIAGIFFGWFLSKKSFIFRPSRTVRSGKTAVEVYSVYGRHKGTGAGCDD
jgi:hypothetical protein